VILIGIILHTHLRDVDKYAIDKVAEICNVKIDNILITECVKSYKVDSYLNLRNAYDLSINGTGCIGTMFTTHMYCEPNVGIALTGNYINKDTNKELYFVRYRARNLSLCFIKFNDNVPTDAIKELSYVTNYKGMFEKCSRIVFDNLKRAHERECDYGFEEKG